MLLFVHVDPLPFPDQLFNYGLTVESLCRAFDSAQSRSEEELSSCWRLRGIPYVEFYRKLHEFLKKWEKTRSLTKIAIGRFYISIDRQLQERGSSPSNTYKFIERIVSSSLPDTSIMSYSTDGTPKKQSDVNGDSEEVDQLASQLKKQQEELSQMKLEVERARQELLSTQCALRDVTLKENFKLNETLCRRRLTK